MRITRAVIATLTLAFLIGAFVGTQSHLRAQAQATPEMTFFITNVGLGNGANLGGLREADRHCSILAAQAGANPARNWRAYLSTQTRPQQPAVHARNRIGTGPWYNAKGVMIAKDVDDLHSDKNNLKRATQLSDKGESPAMHDILTGSGLDGRAVDGADDTTCNNWTSSGTGSALLGHYDRQGGGANPSSWNSAHPSKGCSQANLQSTGGNGLFYCFAAN